MIEGRGGFQSTQPLTPRERMRVLSTDLTDAQVATVWRCVEERRYEKGATVLRERNHGDSILIVDCGQVEVVKRMGTGAEDNITPLPEGSLIGEIGFIDKGPRSSTVRARTDVTVLEFPAVPLRRAMRHDRDLAAKLYDTIARELAARLRSTTDQLWDARTTERFRKQAEGLKKRIARDEARGS